MTPLQTIGSYETKTHLADVLRQVRAGQGFTITQRGELVADLLPAGSGARRSLVLAATRMRQFVQEASKGKPAYIRELMDEGRD